MPEQFTQIGFTKKTHGIGGELKVAIEAVYEDIFIEADRVFLDVKGNKLPFFLENVRGGGELIVKFEDVKNREEAMLLQSRAIFLPSRELPADLEPEDDGLLYADLVGYLLVDKSAGEIGRIEQMIDMPQQELAVIPYKGREVLAPLNERLVLSIDREAKKVFTDLPEGIFEL